MLSAIKSVLRKNPQVYSMAQFIKLHVELLPRRIGFAAHSGNAALSQQEEEMLASLKKDGIAVLPDFLTPEQVAEMRAAIDKSIQEKNFYHAPGRFAYKEADLDLENVGRLNVIDPTMRSPEFIRFALNPSIRKVIDLYLGVDSVLAGIAAYRTKPTPKHPKGAFHWHYDNAYLQVKAIAYLTDVTEKNGPFAYIPNTWRRRLVSANYEETRIQDSEVAEGSYINCVGKAGTVLVVDTQIIHRATPNLEGTRDVVSIVYDAATKARKRSFYNLPIATPDLQGLTPEQRHFLRVPENPGQVS